MTAGRYAAFTFVDRIVALDPGVSARGSFHVPLHAGHFPTSLLAEATGQLAAWVAVAKLGFRLRPVAGIAHETIYGGAPQPGDTLETEVRIDSCEDDAVAYQGWCRIRGATVLELRDCVGPMLPLEDFDDPAAMRAFHDRLLTTGARPWIASRAWRSCRWSRWTTSRGNAPVRASTCRPRRRSSRTTSRAGRCSRGRCCWTA